MEVLGCFPPHHYRWAHNDIAYQKCGDTFQKTPIFDGKTFWGTEQAIEWVTD